MSAGRSALGPWRLGPNRVDRFYEGGALLERFRGTAIDEARDSRRPEDWVGSATRAWTPPGEGATDTGLASVDVGGRRHRIVDLLTDDPEAIAGRDLVARAGPTTGVLVKLLDAAMRLPVHCHPSRSFARANLDSFFGKAEAWIILATRRVAGADAPSLRLGFRRDIDRDELTDVIRRGDSDRLLEAMHIRPAAPGDVWFIPPGLPHAIGAGVFMLEVQEPTDFSIVAETRGFPVDEEDASLGLGWDIAVDAFDRTGYDDNAIDRLRQEPTVLHEDGGLRRSTVIGRVTAPFFRAERLEVTDWAQPGWAPAFLVAVVNRGSGLARTPGGELPLAAGDTFAVPAVAVPDLELYSRAGLDLIACLPPRPEDLDLA